MVPSVKVAKKLADTFAGTLDYLIDDTGKAAEIKDKAMVQRIVEIETLEQENKKTIVQVIDSLLKNKNVKKGVCNVIGVKNMQTESIKQQAHKLLDNLPESATWEDLMYRIYVRQAIEAGIKDSDQGRTLSVKEVRKKFGLPA